MSIKPLAVHDVGPTKAVNLRIEEDLCALIDQAARNRGETRAVFILNAAKRAAEEALFDQTLRLADHDCDAAFVFLHEQAQSKPMLVALREPLEASPDDDLQALTD